MISPRIRETPVGLYGGRPAGKGRPTTDCVAALVLTPAPGLLRTVTWSLSTEGSTVVLSTAGRVEQIVATRTARPGLDRSRRWLVCPLCDHDRATLFLVEHLHAAWACRVCADLGYVSDRLDRGRRAARRARNVRRRLGGQGSLLAPRPPRPKGMHHRTYARLCEALQDAEDQYFASRRRAASRLGGWVSQRRDLLLANDE